ncbi:MAG TPA: AAA family ATPase, partial [Candidatus Binataceae bacterium]|nr:AAA family ATPase [Candidatus Binataceae bacterium]
MFARSGEYWTLGYGGRTFSLKDVLGLSYIQRLLQHPGEEFAAIDLEAGPELPASGDSDLASVLSGANLSVGRPRDLGAMLDEKAKQDFKRRLHELGEELEEFKERGDYRRAAEVESEIDSIADELRRSRRKGGHDRRMGSVAERARLNVTRAIRAALQKVSEFNGPLGELFNQSIRTGLYCSYAPNPRVPVAWQFAVASSGPTALTEAPPPLLSRLESGFPRALGHRTTFVGREAERATLRSFLDQALRGEGKVVMISGAPGVGKTRLADEAGAQAAQSGFLALAGSCYDRDDAVPFSPFVEIMEGAWAQALSLETFRAALGNDAPEIARLMPQLRRLFPDLPPPLEIPPEQSRRLLFDALVRMMTRAAGDRPLLLVLEDLHWADEGTLSLLNHLARLVAKLRVLIVGTYRDYELAPGGPLAATLDELTRLHLLRRITLGGLSQPAVAGMIASLCDRDPPQSVVEFIYSGTDGNPFFVEELFLHLVERGKLLDSQGEFRRDLKLAEVEVPESLRLVIGRRLARLGEETRKMLATAAVLGRSFPLELLEAATRVDTDSLLDRIEEAEKAGLLSSTVRGREARFQFSHELIRQAVVGEISPARRQRLHLQVAGAIEHVYANALEDHAIDL